ncbi:MAG: hypothetical protein NUV56_03195, partial [Candidatus Uhrbacteria bacterium]|nr:hypothetical protein [Candidatus Uhrbacteria bacterium]
SLRAAMVELQRAWNDVITVIVNTAHLGRSGTQIAVCFFVTEAFPKRQVGERFTITITITITITVTGPVTIIENYKRKDLAPGTYEIERIKNPRGYPNYMLVLVGTTNGMAEDLFRRLDPTRLVFATA